MDRVVYGERVKGVGVLEGGEDEEEEEEIEEMVEVVGGLGRGRWV